MNRAISCAQFNKSLTSTKKRDGWKGRQLLQDLANLPKRITPSQLQWLTNEYPEVFRFMSRDGEALKKTTELLARFVRLAWESSNARERSWYLFTVRQEYVKAIFWAGGFRTRSGETGKDAARNLIPLLPAKTPFDLAVHHLQTALITKMAVCERRNCDGDGPCFYSRRKGQKYCGAHCRNVVLQERNNAWWAKNGNEWRRKRRKSLR